ncbi:hypothetical protein [Gemmatimonas sp.]|uniref:hypothetical protein n=1 Tax=Gemmatimonas sp. TaxID=1962908 RepID=UPI00333EE719
MPLALVTTPGPTANAYADRASVVALASYRGTSGAAFLELSEDQQVSAIASAAAEVDSFVIASATLAGATAFPSDLVRANQELAIVRAPLFADGATADPLVPVVSALKRDKTGPLEQEFFEPATTDAASVKALPPVVQRYLTRWMQLPITSVGYGRSTAVRGS